MMSSMRLNEGEFLDRTGVRFGSPKLFVAVHGKIRTEMSFHGSHPHAGFPHRLN